MSFKIKKGVLVKYTGISDRVIIPNSVLVIGDKAFRNCTHVREIIVPTSVVIIGERSFSGCTNLTRVTVPITLKETGAYVFLECDNLNRLTIYDNYSQLKSITVPKSTVKHGYCKRLKKIYAPEYFILQLKNQISDVNFKNQKIKSI